MKNKLMSTLVASLLILTIVFVGCGDSSTNVPTASNNNQTDVPCIPLSNVYIGGSDLIGFGGTMFYTISGNILYLSFDNPIMNGRNIKIQVDNTPIHTTGNMPPGQMDYTLNNIQSGVSYEVHLNFTPVCRYYLYVHSTVGNETVWIGNPGNRKNAGQGGWRWWSTNPCNCN